jgi:hypothetical protein
MLVPNDTELMRIPYHGILTYNILSRFGICKSRGIGIENPLGSILPGGFINSTGTAKALLT